MYLDLETNTYYTKSRIYNQATGRFLSEDTHWNLGNMIYGDNPALLREYEDPLGLNIYTYRPDINSIRQSNNLYVFCGNNPVMFVDPTGEEWYHWAIIGGLVVVAAVATVATAGGAAPALIAVGSVASGMAAATTASTVAAGAFIGTTVVAGGALLTANYNSLNSL